MKIIIIIILVVRVIVIIIMMMIIIIISIFVIKHSFNNVPDQSAYIIIIFHL